MKRIWALPLFLLIVAAVQPAPAYAADRCVRVFRQGNIESLINTCGVCRKVQIIRSRPGSEVPMGRDLNVLPRSEFPLAYKGPGTTRVLSEAACPGDAGADQDLIKSMTKKNDATEEKTCVSMERAGTGIQLVNRCGECRAVALDRYSADGASHARNYMIVAGGSRAPVQSDGFAQVGLAGEIACPKS